jgi:trk system potassium uptake protein TrkA
MMTLLKLRRGEFSLVEETLPAGSLLLQAPLKDLPVPEGCVITAVMRRGQMIIPHGDMIFEEGDEVMAVVDNASRDKLRRLFGSQH